MLTETRSKLHAMLQKSNFTNSDEITQSLPIPLDTISKATVDHAVRDQCLRVANTQNVDFMKKFVQYCLDLCFKKISNATLPIVALSDLFEMCTLNICEQLFSFVEENVAVWREDIFFKTSRNFMLRMCNDLLKRLSRSQNTVFCGRILLFLAQFFPFSERSGLNIVGEFNLENVTEYKMDVSENGIKNGDDNAHYKSIENKSIDVNYSFYSKFWCLQDFFRSPDQCYTLPKWKMFTSYSNTILSTFESYKLEHLVSSKEGGADSLFAANLKSEEEGKAPPRYFAKYLTNQKLLELQVEDATFRRYIYVQFLITLQYLTLPVKFKSESQKLSSSQLEWINAMKGKVYNMIKETPPNGGQFLRYVEIMLQNEEHWNKWKNDSCPELKKPDFDNAPRMDSDVAPEQRLGDILKESAGKNRFYLGHPKMTRLWNLNTNNLASCRLKERDFSPSMDEFFEEAVAQMDPAAMIESQYKKTNESDFTWKALRLLSQKFALFFSQRVGPPIPVQEYLESVLKKMAEMKLQQQQQQLQQQQQPHIEGKNDEKDRQGTASQDYLFQEGTNSLPDVTMEDISEEGEVENEMEEEVNGDTTPLTNEIIDKVAKVMGKNWKELAVKMGFKKEEIELFSRKNSPEESAQNMLKVWVKGNRDSCVESVLEMAEEMNLTEAAGILREEIAS